MGIKLNPTSVDWDGIQSLISRYPESLSEFLISVHNEGIKLGTFKACWKNFAKKYNLKKFDDAIEYPLNENLNTEDELPWNFISINKLK